MDAMPRRCSICDHSERDQLDRALLGATPLRDIAARFKVAASSLHRHRVNHLAPKIANALARHEEVDADRLRAWMLGLQEQTILAAARAKQSEDWLAFRGLVAEARKNLELVGRLAGIIDPVPGVMIDARRQTAVLAGLTEAELRAIAAQAETVEIDDGLSRRTPELSRAGSETPMDTRVAAQATPVS